MSTGIDPIDSAPLIIRTYNDDSADNTFLLTRYDYPVSSNYVLRTSANGSLAPSDALTQTTMAMSSMTISNHFGSTMVYDTFSSGSLFLPAGVFDTIIKTTMAASSVTASTIFLNVLNICTMNASTFSPNGVTVAYTTLGSTVQTTSMTYSTLIGDSFFAGAGFVSTLFGSSIYTNSASMPTTASDTSRISTLIMDSTTVGFLSFSSLQGSTLVLSTLSGSSIYTNPLTVSTLDGGLLVMSTILCDSTLSVSTLHVSGLSFSTTAGSSVTMSTVTAPLLFSHSLLFSTAQGSTMLVSSVMVSSLYASLLVGSTLQVSTLVFSTLSASTVTTSALTYSTAQGSTMLVSTIGVSTLVMGPFSASTLSGSSMTAHTTLFSTLTGSTISWNRVVFSTLQGSNAMVSSVTASTLVSGATVAAEIQGSNVIVSTASSSSLNTNLFVGSTMLSDSLFFSTLTVSTLFGDSAVYSALQGSTVTLSSISVSTLSVSTTVVSTLNGVHVVDSTLTTSSIVGDGIIFFTLHGSTLLLSTLTSCSINAQTIHVSTLQGSTISVSTLTGSTIVSGHLSYSTLIGSTIVTDDITAMSTFTGSGSLFVSSFAFSTQQTSSAFLSTLIVTSTLTVSTLHRINPTSFTASTISLSGGLQANTATGFLVCSSLIMNTMNLSRSLVNQPVYGNTVKTDSIAVSGRSLVRTSGIRATMDNMPNQPQTYTFGPAIPNRWIVGGNGIYPMMYSSDGIQWSGIGSNIFSTCYGIDWNGNMWVAVGLTGAGALNTMAYSYDGIRWIGIGMDIFIYGGSGISSNGTIWVATGYGINSMAYSYDGINWTGLGESVFSGSGGIAWNGTMWVALGNGTNSIAYSYDGIVWTGLGTGIFTVGASGIAWNGTMWVAVGDGLNSIAYSYDGINWIGLGTSIFTIRGHVIAWNGTMWVAVGWGTNSIAYSYNGINWFGLGTSIFTTRGNGIAWNGNMWVAVGNNTKSIAYSYDGISWTGLDTGEFLSGQTIKYNGQRSNTITFPAPMTVATGSGTNTLAYSPDGINWTGVGLGIFSANGAGVATNGSMWVATGSGTNTLAYSTTDIETPYIHLPFENGLYADVMGNSTITATGSPAFVTGTIGSTAVNLINIAGSLTATQYLDGNCTLGNNFSVSLWFKFNTLPATDVSWSSIITLGSPTTMSFQIIYLTLAGHTGFYVQYMQTGNVAASIVGRISITPGTWYHCTAIFQSAGMCSVYLNNTFVGSNPGGGLHTPITNLRIGYNLATSTSAFDGSVDDVRIYNYAITVNPRITWRGLGTSVFSTEGKGVAWNGNMWVAVGSGTNSIAYSYDGVTWIGLGLLVLTQGNAVAWSGSMWVAVGSGTNSIAYSYNGISWVGLGGDIFSTQGNSVAWNGSMWVAVGSGSNTIAYSYDGQLWVGINMNNLNIPTAYLSLENLNTDTFGNLTSPTTIGTVTYSNSIYKVGNYSAYFGNTPGIFPAPNTLEYTTPPSFHNPTAFTVSFWMYPTAFAPSTSIIPIGFGDSEGGGGLRFVLYDNAGVRSLGASFATTTSISGIGIGTLPFLVVLSTWIHVVFTFSIVNGKGVGIMYVNGVSLGYGELAGTGGLGIITSGGPMTRLTLGSYTRVRNSGYAGYIDDVRIYTSTLTPSNVTSLYNSPTSPVYLNQTTPPFTSSGNGVAWNGNRWVAVGSGENTILYSDNGLTWLAAASSCFTTAGNGVSWNGTRWVATGSGTNGIGYSSDGSTWTGGIVQNRTNTLTPQLTGLGAANWIQNGIAWRASASTEYLGVHYAYHAFTNNSSSVNTWGSALIYNTTSGAYTGSISTTIQSIGATLGEWIQLQSTTPLILQSYSYACWGIATLPKEYYIVGSNDGSTWYPLQYVLMSINPCNATFTACSTYIQMNYTGVQNIIGNLTGSGMTTAYSYTTGTYTYFRMIVRSLWPSSTGVAEFNELYFRFGSPFVFNTFDPSRYYYHYTLYAGATVTPSSYKPYTPSITLASASSQYLQTANFTPTTAGLSFAFWYKSNGSGSWARIFDFGNAPASNNIFCSINGGNANYLYFEDFNGSVPTNITISDTNYNDNTWRHVVWTLSYAVVGSNTSTWNIYVNGTLKTTVSTKSYPNPAVTRTLSYIGRSNWVADAYYNGNIDDFRIYNTVLTAPQVTTIYSDSLYDSTYNTTFSTAGSGIASNNSLSGTVMIQHPVIAVGQGTHSLAYSPDGVQWTGLGTALFTTGYCVAWNGSKWMVGGLAGANTLAYSYDGIQWTGLGTTIFSTQVNGIAWNGSLWIAVGSGLNTIAYSTDGLSWTGINNTNFTSCNAIAWNGKQWVAVGTGTSSIAYSADGITWTAISSTIFSIQGNGIAWTGSLWVAVGTGTNSIAYSSDGITWTPSPTGNSIFTDSANSVAWNGTRWVAVGAGASHTIAYSANGTVWTGFGKTIFPTAGNGVCWTGTRFVAVGANARIGYSQDGLTWYTAPSGIFSTQGNGVAGNPRLGATVSDSQVALSDSLDVVSDTYYNTGYTNLSAMIQSQTYTDDKSNIVTVIKTLPGAPTNVSGALYPIGAPIGARVSFTYPTNTGGGVDAYYASAIDVAGVQPTVTASSPSQPITIIGLIPGTTYQFTVYSSNSAGQSAATASVSNLLFQVPPSAPQNYSVLRNSLTNPTGIDVSFTAPSNLGGGIIINYTVTPYQGGTPVLSAQTGTGLSYTFTGLTPGTVYTFLAVGNNAAGAGAAASSSVTYYTNPDPPTVGAITLQPPTSPTGVHVAFTAPINTGGSALTYVAHAYYTTQFGSTLLMSISAPSSSSPLYLTNLTEGTLYIYRVFAYNNTIYPRLESDLSIPSAPTLY